jgi:hypothetical protein
VILEQATYPERIYAAFVIPVYVASPWVITYPVTMPFLLPKPSSSPPFIRFLKSHSSYFLQPFLPSHLSLSTGLYKTEQICATTSYSLFVRYTVKLQYDIKKGTIKKGTIKSFFIEGVMDFYGQ